MDGLKASGPLYTQIGAIVVASAVIVLTVLLTSNQTINGSEASSRKSEAALLIAHMDSEIHEVEGYLEDAQASEGPLLLGPSLDAHDAAGHIAVDAGELLGFVDTADTRAIATAAIDARTALRTYFSSQSTSDKAAAVATITALDETIEGQVEALHALADADQAELREAAGLSRTLLILTALIAALVIVSTTFVLGRRQANSLVQLAEERDHLRVATDAVGKRNEQFSALYQVVTEITDSLSMKYVVNTAVKEAAKLVKADHAELRLLDGDNLVAREVPSENGETRPAAGPLPLGIGLAGKAAKRGRTMRIDAGVEALMADEERLAGMESGLVVPLIVGARVVGTLSCWSAHRERFDEDDERVLELMASQVATAVAAADLHEVSERKAHHDALTGLPNRRQLVEEMPAYQEAIDYERSLALVMIDIDHFKRFNDDFGHRVGDITLQKVAEVMRGAGRETDQLYRYGGEEFLLVIEDVKADEAMRMVDRVRRSVEKTILTGERMEPVGPVTISAGVALSPANGTDFTALLEAADRALYISKESGRNRATLSEEQAWESEVESEAAA